MSIVHFIDCGAYRGKALTWALKRYGRTCKRYAFECNPLVKFAYDSDVEVHRKAVWTCDGELRFYMNLNSPTIEGHSVYKDKTTGCLNTLKPRVVPCIDFSQWLKTKFENKGSDTVVVKMNVEGAEYDVLERCVNEGSTSLIDYLFVQWHHKKIPGMLDRHEALIAKLSEVPTLTVSHGYGKLRV